MNIDSIVNGIVIDHITAGRGKEIYNLLHLSNLDCMVALITNAASVKMGRKDIIKIAESIELDTDALGYVDPGVTVSIICDGKTIEKKKLDLPLELEGVLHCKNPRCITSTEQELTHEFRLTDPANKVYRCIYCENVAPSIIKYK